MSEKRKPTIAELEAILNEGSPQVIEILPNGELRARRSDDPHYLGELDRAQKRVKELEAVLERQEGEIKKLREGITLITNTWDAIRGKR